MMKITGSIALLWLTTITSCLGQRYLRQPAISADSAAIIKNRILRYADTADFKPVVYTGMSGISIRARLLGPMKRENRKRYPLVLVFHSSGRPIGTDNTSQLGVLPRLWAQPAIREEYPAYILAPQFPRRSSNYTPAPGRKVLASTPDSCLIAALELVDSLKASLPIDGKRIYVMGFSMGGSTTINALGLRPDLFAAGVSISGIPDFDHLQTLARTPLWLIHGNSDTENPMSSDSVLYEEIKAMHGHHLTFWEIKGLQHEIDPELYASDIIPHWFFRQKKD